MSENAIGNNPQEKQYREEIERLLTIEIQNVKIAVTDVELKHKRLMQLYPRLQYYQEIVLEDVPGAWGTAYAAASALAGAGVRELRVLNRTVPRARELGRHLRRHFPKCPVTVGKLGLADLNKALSGADLLVSTVQSGLEKIAGRIPKDELSRIFVYDVVYARETPLLKAARRARARRMDGLGMLAHQGALAFELWTGKTAPVAIMKKALKGK
jgi:shikimate 5-dehydrogenase